MHKFWYRFKLLAAAAMLTFSVDCLAGPTGGKPKRIIFLIGDGMGLTQIYAGMTAQKGKSHFRRFKSIGFSITNSSDDYITDSAAGATAFSIGKKTFNGAIGVDATGTAHPTILELAENAGYSTGLVATSAITHATPASFIAHVNSRKEAEDIALDFLKTDIDVFIGGGRDHFTKRKDGKNLLADFKSKGYTIVDTTTRLAQAQGPKLAAVLSADGMPKMQQGRGPILGQATHKALDILKDNGKGFFLMVEGSQIDWGGHAKDLAYVIAEQKDFDEVVGQALDFAEKDGNTLVVVTADHETGGLGLTGGNIATGDVKGEYIWGKHTAVMVPVFAFGPGAEVFQGIDENTSIYYKMMAYLGLKPPYAPEKP